MGQEGGRSALSLEAVRAGVEQLAGREPEMSAKREETRRRILRAAARVFVDRGFRRTSMEDVAAAAAVSRGTLYLYAKNKDDLILRTLAEETLSLLSREPPLAVFVVDLPPQERLRRSLAESMSRFQHTPLSALLVKGELQLAENLQRHPLMQAALPGVNQHRFIAELVRDAVGHRLDEAACVTAAEVIYGVVATGPQLIDAWTVLGLNIDEAAERLASLLVDGLCPPPSGRERSVQRHCFETTS